MKVPRLAWGLATIASVCVVTFAQSPMQPPRIWDDRELEDWATPIAALNLRPTHVRTVAGGGREARSVGVSAQPVADETATATRRCASPPAGSA